MSDAGAKDYKSTLNLPQTGFPMKGNLAQLEPKMLAAWEEKKVFQLILEKNKAAPPFVLHDGPPYANGRLHAGHALNKILKDIVVKYRNLSGQKADFVPGWDCHGLPIEQAVERTRRRTRRTGRQARRPRRDGWCRGGRTSASGRRFCRESCCAVLRLPSGIRGPGRQAVRAHRQDAKEKSDLVARHALRDERGCRYGSGRKEVAAREVDARRRPGRRDVSVLARREHRPVALLIGPLRVDAEGVPRLRDGRRFVPSRGARDEESREEGDEKRPHVAEAYPSRGRSGGPPLAPG
jgi:hypothetical protein